MPPLPEEYEGNSPSEELQRANESEAPQPTEETNVPQYSQGQDGHEPPGGLSSAARTSEYPSSRLKAPDLRGNNQEKEVFSNRVGITMGQLAGRAQGVFKSRKGIAALGGGAGIIALMVAAFVALLPLKLEHILKNIEAKRMGVEQHDAALTDNAFMNDYTRARLSIGDDDPDAYFRSKGIDPNRPFVSWYKYMRGSSFEKQLAKNQGIRFVNDARTGSVVMFMNVNGEQKEFNKSTVSQVYDTHNGRYADNAAARAAIRDAVDKETLWYQYVKRHNMRMWMQKTLGVDKWTFFGKYTGDAKAYVRTQYAKFVLTPVYAHLGTYMDCILGGSNCPTSTDLNASENQFPASAAEASNPNAKAAQDAAKTAEQAATDPTANIGTAEAAVADKSTDTTIKAFKPATLFEALVGKELASKLVPGIGLLSTIQVTDNADHFIRSNELGKVEKNIKQSEDAADFAQLAIEVDDLKGGNAVGKSIDPKLVNALMNKYSGIEKSRSYDDIANPGKPSAYHVPDISNFKSSSADDFSNGYKNSVLGKVAEGVLSPVRACEAVPACGSALHAAETVVNGVSNFILGKLSSFALGAINDVSGGSLDKFIGSLIGKLVGELLGAGATGTEVGGDALAVADAGASVTANAYMESVGAPLLSLAAAAQLNAEIAQENAAAAANQPPWVRIASLSNPTSVASRILDATPLSTGEMEQAAVHIFAALPNPFSLLKSQSGHIAFSLITPPSLAAGSDPDIYGVDPHGFTADQFKSPTNCTDPDALTTYQAAVADGSYTAKYPNGDICAYYQTFEQNTQCGMNDDTTCSGVTAPTTTNTTPTTPTNGHTVVLDPGHSGQDKSITDPATGLIDHDYPNQFEIDEVFNIAKKVKTKLEADGYTVVMTKNGVDDTVSLRQRADIANNANADLAVSIHDDHSQPWDSFAQIYVQQVGLHRDTASGQEIKFTDMNVAQKSQQYGQTFAQARTAAEGHTVTVTTNDFTGRAGLSPGNIPLVELFAKVPWVYNEVGAAPLAPLSQRDQDKYAQGLIDSIEKSIPISGGSS